MSGWQLLTRLGDSSLLVPLGLALALALWLGAERRLCLRWLVAFGAVGLTVSLTKLAYLARGWGVDAVQFRGLSGHTALATVSYPLLAWATLGPRRPVFVRMTLGGGLVLGLLIGISRFEVHAHTPSEVVTGFAVGALAALHVARGLPLHRPQLAGLRPGVAALALLCLLLGPAPSQALLETVASHL